MTAHQGPWVVTVRPGHDDDCGALTGHPLDGDEAARCSCGKPSEPVARWAYGTLEEAREACRVQSRDPDVGGERRARILDAIDALPGTITLPDGREVVVEATTWPKLASMVQDGAYLPEPQILDAWNAEHGIGGGA